LIWGSDRSKFSPAPEIQYKGRTIYVYGLIELYQGSAEIIVTEPSQIQVR
jgi:DNA/RNA endonuclease YhcR with UshA esterase domain